MNDDLRLERTATELLDAAAPSRAPVGLLADTLTSVGRTRQRARWLANLKEPPMRTPNGVVVGSPTFRLVTIAFVTLALILGLTAAVAGGASLLLKTAEVPSPFGLAANGLVAYAQDGDIYAVDPVSGARRAIVTGPDVDVEPRWSLDGTRLLFLRTVGDLSKVGVVDPNRPDEPVMTNALALDGDRVKWSPDGRSISVGLEAGILIVDASSGEATPLDFDITAEDLFWRPPDGRQAMVVGGDELYLLDLDDAISSTVVAPGTGGIRASGWTPDGRRFVYQRGEFDELPFETHILDMVTGDDVVISAGYGHVSNDGTRMVMHERTTSSPCQSREGCPSQMCVVDLGGGDCSPIGLSSQAYDPSHAEGVHWSPDDEWLLTRSPAGDGTTAYLVDPDGEIVGQPAWISDGGESWQRLAP
jgi:Tol biopolymer transport system component